MATTLSVTALDDSAHGNVDETHFENHKFQVRCNEADVGSIISSAGKTSQQGDWFGSDGGYQVMLPGPGEQTRTCAKDSNVAKLEENHRVYWLPGSAAENTDGAPLIIKFRVVWMIVEATTDSETEFDAIQLEESEETRRLKHKTILRHVNRDIHDARQIAHLQSKTRSGETVDQAHRPQAGRHEGDDRRGKDHLFSSNATDPQHGKAVLNRLESEAAFSAMSVIRVEARLMGACEAFRSSDRTRLNEMRAVQNTVCETPKASSANAERIERASQMVEKRSRTSRSWFEGISVERVCNVMPDTVCHCAWQTSRRLARPGRAKQNEGSRRHNGRVSKFTKMNHFTDEWNLRLRRNAVMVSSGHWKGKLVRVCGCRIVWRCPENQRWDRKLLTEMNGEPWNTPPRQEEKLQIKDREYIALKHLTKCGGQRGSMACCEHAGTNLRDLKARTQDIADNEVVQTKNQRKFERLTEKPTKEFEQSTVQSSTGGTAMAAGRPAPDSQMTLAAVAESATTQSTTSSRIRVVETEDQSNIECQKVLASSPDRHGTIEDMDTCGAIVLTIDPEDCDGWTQQVVDRNKKCCGAKSGDLGHLYELQKVSMRRINEFVNIEKERHCTASVVWRSMTAWNEHETDKCWEEVKSILTGELDIGVPTTFVSENHGCVVVHRGTNFPSSGIDAESNETGCVRMAHSDTKTMPRIKPTWNGGEMKGKHNSCRGMRWSLQGSEWGSNSKHVDDMKRLWRLKQKSKETPTLVTKATERRRNIDETLMQHDVRASREAAGTSSPAVKSSIHKGTWLYRRQADPKTLRMSEHTSDSRRTDQGNCVEHCG